MRFLTLVKKLCFDVRNKPFSCCFTIRVSSVVEPGHFGIDPGSLIRTTDLRIQIRIRILRFRQWLTRCQQKICFFQGSFAYYFLKVHLHPSQRSHKIEEIKVFLTFFLLIDERIQILIRSNNYLRIREAQKHRYGSGSTTLLQDRSLTYGINKPIGYVC